MLFSTETEKGNKLVTVYRKNTFGDTYGNFESFFPSVYKFGMVYASVYSCFCI